MRYPPQSIELVLIGASFIRLGRDSRSIEFEPLEPKFGLWQATERKVSVRVQREEGPLECFLS